MNDVPDGAESAEPVPPTEPAPPAEPNRSATGDGGPVEDLDGPTQFRMRRAPKYGAFGTTGLVIGVIVGLVLAFSHAADGDYSEQTIAGYFAASFGLIGVLLGLGIAVVADRRK